jgi:hypothetical protein
MESERDEVRRVVSRHAYRGLVRLFYRFTHSKDAASVVVGSVIGAAVCAPFIGGGRLFLLDWSIGPHVPVASASILGLNGGLTSGAAGSFVVSVLNPLLGSTVTWLPILLFFPLATVGAARLVGRTTWTRVAAGILYAVNPFVFNRLFVGHVPLLIGYALLPYATSATLRSIASRPRRWPVPALWWAVLTALSPHFAWIFGVIVLGVFIVAWWTARTTGGRAVLWLATTVGLFALLSAYILLPQTATNLPVQVGSVSLDLYRTIGDPHLGLLANVLGLYGFWRLGPGPELPKDMISGWPFLMLAILTVVVIGARSMLRNGAPESSQLSDATSASGANSRPRFKALSLRQESRAMTELEAQDGRPLGFVLLLVGIGGYFLALGGQGPTGGLFNWAYDHVPFFALMREPQKFLMLLVLALAIFFGRGVGHIARSNFFKSKFANVAMTAVVGVALPLGYTANIFGGLGGQVAPSSVPVAYQQADALMGTGAGNILYLPWHLYMAYTFTGNRIVANIGADEFRRTVIAGDNVEAGDVESQSSSPRSRYLQQLFADGAQIKQFGALVAPLGVQFVVLAKTVDWHRYAWLNSQGDLLKVFDSSSLEVWRNVDYSGAGWKARRITSVRGVNDLLALAKSKELSGRVTVLKDAKAHRSTPSSSKTNSTSVVGSSKRFAVQQLSPVAYRISPGSSGWVTVDAPFQRGWSVDGRPAGESAEGTLLIRVGPNGGMLQFTPWRLVRLGYGISVFGFVVLFCSVLAGDRWRRRLRTSVPDSR